MRRKITIVGAGQVGTTVAQLVAYKNLGNVVLIDVVEGVPQGKALDLQESGCLQVFDSLIIGTNDYKDTADSDVVVITAGVPRGPGQSRSDLLATNAKIVKTVTEQVMKYSSNPFIIVVSNPLDAMVYMAKKVSGLPKQRIVGMAGVLDSARFRTFVSLELDCSLVDVDAMVLGGHGDSMVPLPRYTTVSGISITDLMTKEQIARLVDRTRKGGAEIVGLLKQGSAFLAPGASVMKMIEAVLLDNKRILPCTAYLDGEYGWKDIFLGVPVKLGSHGIEQVIELVLNPDEKAALDKSAQDVKEMIDEVNAILAE
ncbi:MAG: malate dehydrogenase [Nitrospinae bacterium CG11_big_fil_rev_8_21_14_0_20_56_8]|nr:MAG: malate dehydrogenase [Nitrospinae bacterium CG11_big_fil_rev_8_21_14_0_20_56_8]